MPVVFFFLQKISCKFLRKVGDNTNFVKISSYQCFSMSFFSLKLLGAILQIENRAGNKKVTLVNNLSLYGIDCKVFCQQVQVGVATSATLVDNAPVCEGPQVLILGNQVSSLKQLFKEFLLYVIENKIFPVSFIFLSLS